MPKPILERPVDLPPVITVPAYFADARRKATIPRPAAREARSGRHARIINEADGRGAWPTGSKKSGVEETVLIYDLGGGTFDVTVARVAPDSIDVLSTAGDHDLGGKNWDDRIASYLAEKFATETGVDPLDDPSALNEVLLLAEGAEVDPLRAARRPGSRSRSARSASRTSWPAPSSRR